MFLICHQGCLQASKSKTNEGRMCGSFVFGAPLIIGYEYERSKIKFSHSLECLEGPLLFPSQGE